MKQLFRMHLLLFISIAIGLWGIYNLWLGDQISRPEILNQRPETSADFPSTPTDTRQSDYEIITLIPPDTIQAIDSPQFVTGTEADAQYQDDELVIGIELHDDARAYSIPFLSRHEIVNDVVGGEPIAVTW
ncbi:DUF3179 domain-containing protein [Chloroflexi bacterium TSY]|nr:DUF3179 domain-containing protein [Chloroflexi bacterium TSY]